MEKTNQLLGVCPVCQQQDLAVYKVGHTEMDEIALSEVEHYRLYPHDAFGSPCAGAGECPQAIY